MIVSFSGLLFSSLDLLLQYGLCLVINLVFNVFVIVPIMSPAISYICGEFTMWPGTHRKE